MNGVPEYSSGRGSDGDLTTDLLAGLRYVRATRLVFALLTMSTVVGMLD
jgi:hypothetical protein